MRLLEERAVEDSLQARSELKLCLIPPPIHTLGRYSPSTCSVAGTSVGTGAVVNQTHRLLLVCLICMGGREAITRALTDLLSHCEEVRLTGDWM